MVLDCLVKRKSLKLGQNGRKKDVNQKVKYIEKNPCVGLIVIKYQIEFSSSRNVMGPEIFADGC